MTVNSCLRPRPPAETSQEEREAEREATALLQQEVEAARETIAEAEARLGEIRERIKGAAAEAAALKQAEGAVRKEQAEVIKQAERAEKQVGSSLFLLRHGRARVMEDASGRPRGLWGLAAHCRQSAHRLHA